jgi:predicted ferric reductase
MITIDIYHFAFSDELKDTCIEFTESLIGSSKNLRILKEDENDPESSYSILLDYADFNLEDFEFYDELRDFATENEVVVIVYDHDSKTRKGFWYDEEDEWITQEIGEQTQYQ